MRFMFVVAALYGALGVGLGAYQAHGLREALESRQVPTDQIERRLENARVGVQYQLIHALAMMAIVALPCRRRPKFRLTTCVVFAVGVLLFSGGLAMHALLGHLGHPAIIPTGGTLLLGGWIALALYAAVYWQVQESPRRDSLG